ncbi:MAG: hypothetical protein M0027_10460 [Candidatus Dormibacteraeota bacterium]|nr:hypothetical protein [Candidatus Dormibacteraeota bacterium]
MIAICAACHDSVHRGSLRISDGDLYRWKGLQSNVGPTAHLYVDPGPSPRLLLGSITVRGDSGLVVFDFANHHRLSFTARDGEILLLNSKLSDLQGKVLLDVVDGYVRQRAPELRMQTRPGRIQIPEIPLGVLPPWAQASLTLGDPAWAAVDSPLLDLEVLEPGLVRVQGIWMDGDKGVVVTRDRMCFLDRQRPRPVAVAGAGTATVLTFVGPVGTKLFGI